ncbi:MAG TPA: hypothetical protein VI547_04915 [Anaerolineales bacterium]|nr:hypothetical protein [Anaerolineales bacterium]
MKGVFLLLVLALIVAVIALPQPERLSGVRSLDSGWAIPMPNFGDRIAVLILPTLYGYGGYYGDYVHSVLDTVP